MDEIEEATKAAMDKGKKHAKKAKKKVMDVSVVSAKKKSFLLSFGTVCRYF